VKHVFCIFAAFLKLDICNVPIHRCIQELLEILQMDNTSSYGLYLKKNDPSIEDSLVFIRDILNDKCLSKTDK